MISFAPGMGGGSKKEPEADITLNRISLSIAAFLSQQEFFDVTEVVNTLGLSGLILDTVVPPESRFSLTALCNPQSFTFTLEVTPPVGRAIHDCTEFLIDVSLDGQAVGKHMVSLETGRVGSERMRIEEAVRFQAVLEAASKAAL